MLKMYALYDFQVYIVFLEDFFWERERRLIFQSVLADFFLVRGADLSGGLLEVFLG